MFSFVLLATPTALAVLPSELTQPTRKCAPMAPRFLICLNAAASPVARLYRKSDSVNAEACSAPKLARYPRLGENGSFVLSIEALSESGESRWFWRSASSVGESQTP